MKRNKAWAAILIMGIAFIISGLAQIYWRNYVLMVWLILIGIGEILLSLILIKPKNSGDK
ncbi:hypothetical protein [uncultured Ruminococcus sp.]|uniref:hypothetical protein n=1 Tax=uncultured Ruminococcus sp. TaxID=165186 RepID=UPI0025F69707|nr:hypothetical protein [uncultured Ruminococcus sp.]